MIRDTNRDEDNAMSKQEAIAALNDQWAQGDIDADEYELERRAIDYAHGEAMSAQDDRRVVA